MKRDAAQTIWRTVVFAGAMLGAPACTKKQAQTTPTNNTQPATTDTQTPPADNAAATTTTPPNGEPTADPCAGTGDERPRGVDEDGGGGVGRGFVLS